MLTSHDFRELLRSLARYEVRYLVVGGYAVMKYTEPRYTKDLDVWIATDRANAEAVYRALADFGAPLANLTPADFAAPGHFYKMGRAPLRVDVMMSLPGLDFEQAWPRREEVTLDDLVIPFLSFEDLLRAKEVAGRPQDLIDAARLREALQSRFGGKPRHS